MLATTPAPSSPAPPRAALLIALAVVGCHPGPPPSPRVSPDARAQVIAAATATPQTTSVVVLIDGAVAIEHYAPGVDAGTLHDTRSVGKTITALAVGAAIGRGAIADVDASVLAAWPAAPAGTTTGMRYRDLLTMRSALACDDGDPASPGNEDRMHEQRAWTAWALALPRRPGPDAPDAPLRYCTANAFLLGQAVARQVGAPFDAFVDEALFAPLGIRDRAWMRSPAGEVMTGGGLRLRTRDLATLGELIRRRGAWGGRALVPAAFLDDATTVHTSAGHGRDYGYLMWHYAFPSRCGTAPAWFMAGNGGSVVAVLDRAPVVVAITRTAYNDGGAADQTIALVGAIVDAIGCAGAAPGPPTLTSATR